MVSVKSRRRLLVAALGALALAASVVSLSADAAAPWTGLGAMLSDWAKAYQKDTTDCSKGCYGGRVKDGRQAYRFVGVLTIGKPPRVYSYRQAIGNGTPLAAAKRAVLALLPPDSNTTWFWIDHNDGHGNSCAFWDLHSKTIASLLANYYHPKTGKALAPSKPGDIGVELSAVGTNGYGVKMSVVGIGGYVYIPNDVPDAKVGPVAFTKSSTCA